MRFVRLSEHRLCDNCRRQATRRLEGITGLVRLNLCGQCIGRLRVALDQLAKDDPAYEQTPEAAAIRRLGSAEDR